MTEGEENAAPEAPAEEPAAEKSSEDKCSKCGGDIAEGQTKCPKCGGHKPGCCQCGE